MAVGGVDTYYDYDEHRWKYRRLGGGPVHDTTVRPDSHQSSTVDDDRTAQKVQTAQKAQTRQAQPRGTAGTRTARVSASAADG